jgi:cytochrome P450
MNEASSSSSSSSSSNGVAAIAVALIVATSGSLYGYLRMRQMKKRAETPCFPGLNIPMAKGANFLLGHLLLLDGDGDFREGYRTVYEEPADPTTGSCSLWFVNSPTLSVLLGSHVKTVLSSSSFRESMWLIDCHNDNFLGRKALTSLMGKEWKVYRSAVHKSFTPAALKQSQGCIIQVGKTLVDSLLQKIDCSSEGSIQQPVLSLMKMATIDVFGLAILDVNFDCCHQLQLSPIASAFEFLAEEYSRRLSTPWDPTSWIYQLPTAANLKHREKRSFIRSFIAKQIDVAQANLDDRTAPGEYEHDNVSENNANLLTNILTVAKAEADKNGRENEISKSAILDLVMTLLFGGYDTTSITLTYAFYLMAIHPEIEQECLLEINNVMATGGEELHDPSQHLPYTQAVILETLRLFPPAPTTSRTLEKPIELVRSAVDEKANQTEKICIPEKTTVLIPIWSIQRDVRNFPKPLEIHPTRWVKRTSGAPSGRSQWIERPPNDNADEESMVVPPANRDAFCVFAAGARNCVGRKLAMQEAVTIFAILLQKVKFQLVEGYIAQPKLCSVVQQPSGGLPMKISTR